MSDHDAPINTADNDDNQLDAGSLVSGGKGASAKGGKGGKGKGGKKGKGKAAPGGGGKGKGKGKGKSGGGKGKSGGGKGGGTKPKVMRSLLAELTFPVGRIHSRMKASVLRKQRIGGTAAIYLTALLEYLTAELLDLSGSVCEQKKQKRITPRHILLAIRGDSELNELVTAHIARGGVAESGVAKQLLNKGSKAAREAAALDIKGGSKKSKKSASDSKKKGKKSAGTKKEGGEKKASAGKKSSKKSGAAGKKKGTTKKGSSPTASPKKKSAA